MDKELEDSIRREFGVRHCDACSGEIGPFEMAYGYYPDGISGGGHIQLCGRCNDIYKSLDPTYTTFDKEHDITDYWKERIIERILEKVKEDD